MINDLCFYSFKLFYYKMLSPLLRQIWLSLGILIHMLCMGIMLSYSSSLLPGLSQPDSPIKVDLDTASWISSSIGLSSIPGTLISAYLMQWRGRKEAHIFGIIPSIVGWMLIYFADRASVILLGRVCSGFTIGATGYPAAIAIGEYSSPKYRGTFLGLKTAMVCLGGMVCHILGNFFNWRKVAVIALIPQIISLAIIFTWPESPYWLVSKNRYDDCRKSFYWLRGKSEESRNELDDLIRAQKERIAKTVTKPSFTQTLKTFFNKFTQKDFVKPTIIMLFADVLLEASGRYIFPAYSTNIISEITGSKTISFYYILIVDFITTASATFSSYLVKIMKRRTLLFSFGFLSIVVLSLACIYVYLVSIGILPKEPTWAPLCLFVIYFIFVNLGCTPIALAIIGEIYPLAHKETGSVLTGAIGSLVLLATFKITPGMLVTIHLYGTFAVFGAALFVSLVVLYIMLPETKNRTLQEIEDYFMYGRFTDHKFLRDDADAKMISLDQIST